MNIYYPLWRKYLLVITVQMRNALKEGREIKMHKAEFEAYGNRMVSDYFFNLETKNGKVVNNIGGTAVARDLFDILSSDVNCKKLMANNYYKFSLGKEFVLRISIK